MRLVGVSKPWTRVPLSRYQSSVLNLNFKVLAPANLPNQAQGLRLTVAFSASISIRFARLACPVRCLSLPVAFVAPLGALIIPIASAGRFVQLAPFLHVLSTTQLQLARS